MKAGHISCGTRGHIISYWTTPSLCMTTFPAGRCPAVHISRTKAGHISYWSPLPPQPTFPCTPVPRTVTFPAGQYPAAHISLTEASHISCQSRGHISYWTTPLQTLFPAHPFFCAGSWCHHTTAQPPLDTSPAVVSPTSRTLERVTLSMAHTLDPMSHHTLLIKPTFCATAILGLIIPTHQYLPIRHLSPQRPACPYYPPHPSHTHTHIYKSIIYYIYI